MFARKGNVYTFKQVYAALDLSSIFIASFEKILCDLIEKWN